MYVHELYTDCSQNKNYFANKKKKTDVCSLSLSKIATQPFDIKFN